MITIMPTRERPILFSGEMVRAVLDGRKTQTRRIVKKILGYREFFFDDDRKIIDAQSLLTQRGTRMADADTCPYGKLGDRLWVRETFTDQFTDNLTDMRWVAYRADVKTLGHVSGKKVGIVWHPSIFMPRWASRLTLEVTAVRVERLQDISDADAQAEGVAKLYRNPRWLNGEARCQFETLWDSINGKRAPWASNPWVWVLEFKCLQQVAAGDNGKDVIDD